MNRELFIIMMGTVLNDDNHFSNQQKSRITVLVAEALKKVDDYELSMLSNVIVDNIDNRHDRALTFKEMCLNNTLRLDKLINKVKGLEDEQDIKKK